MKVAVAQIAAQVGRLEDNYPKLRSFTEEAHARTCDLVVFPELADTGYIMENLPDNALDWDAGGLESIQQLAKCFDISIVCGLSQRQGDEIFNSVAAIDSGGALIGQYQKTHLFSLGNVSEPDYLTPGNSLSQFELGDFRFSSIVCYDLRFPEITRTLALRGVQAFVVPSAFPFPRLSHWEVLTSCRAIENQAYVIAANRTGMDGDTWFCGASRIVDPYGVVLTSASEAEEALLVADIDVARVKKVRSGIQVFRDRRPELYCC